MHLRLFAALGGMILASMAFATAHAQDMRSLNDQVLRLQRDVDVLQRRLATGAVSAPAAAPLAGPAVAPEGFAGQVDQRFSVLEQIVREQTGRVEEMQFRLRQLEAKLDRLIQDVEFRFQQVERGSGPTPGQAEPPRPMPPLAGQPTPAAQPALVPPAPPPTAAAPVPAQAQPSAPLPGWTAPVGATPSPAAAPPPSAAAAPPAGAAAPGAAGQRFVLVPSGTSAQALQQQAAGAGPAAAPAPTAAAAPQMAAVPRQPGRLPPGPPEAQYEYAYGLLVQAQRGTADFAPAEQALKSFVDQHPSHRLAGDAQYWYGETLFARQDWQGAALAFTEGFKRYPNAERAPYTTLGMGRALARLNRKQDACGAFAELARRYPNAPPDVRNAAQREQNGC
jgi:tol-pal system protein YbgF